MTRQLALLRPEPGWSRSAAAGRALGLKIVGRPLFEAEPVAWTAPVGAFDGLLVGSAAAFEQGGAELAQVAHLPVHAVGAATASAARSAGFTVARVGEGGLQQLLDDSAGEAARYLRLCGEERVALAPHAGQQIAECAVYRMRPIPIATDLTDLLAGGAPLVALHSAAAARYFGEEIDRLGIARGRLFVIALAPRIAKAAGLGWAALHIADRPEDAALLAKAAALCK